MSEERDGRRLGVAEVLRALADLAPSAEQRAEDLTVPTEWFRWLDLAATRLFRILVDDSTIVPPANLMESRTAHVDRGFGEQLAKVDLIRPEERSLRVGWLFVAGRLPDGSGKRRKILHPLVTLPIRVKRLPGLGLGRAQLVPAGDVELTALVTDPARRRELERRVEVGGGVFDGVETPSVPRDLLARLAHLREFAQAAAAAAELPARRLVPVDGSPEQAARRDDLAIVAGVAVYAVHETTGISRAGSLRMWAERRLDRPTAFHSIYLDPDDDGAADAADERDGDVVESPYLLTPAQQNAVVRSRAAPVTLISGAPGTGKSHTVAAIACDALARGETVLVAAKTDATVDALLDLLERAPGPDPVVFGSSERREALATRLAAGVEPVSAAAVRSAREHQAAAANRRDRLRQDIADRLAAEQLLADDRADCTDQESEARLVAPGLFDATVDLEPLHDLIAVASTPVAGWWRWLRRRHQRRAAHAVRRLAKASADTPTGEIAAAATVARSQRLAAALTERGGLKIGDDWDRLLRLDDEARRLTARWLAADSRSDQRFTAATLPRIAALATALRSGREARRAQLERIDAGLARALPLWVGTLPDIDDLLPPVSGLFDLVILDEASSIDQPLAAPALPRARRAVVSGDPRQLRHVSFVGDRRLGEVAAAHGLDAAPVLAARLDVRRNSAFDVAAGVAPVITLDEHFRCRPHLMDFVARRLYDGRLRVATWAPSTESRDCVDVVRLDGRRDGHGVVEAEVGEVLRQLRHLRRQGATSVGVVTPFRAQADAIESAVLGAMTADDLEALDLRVGTVHGFQGNERDTVVVSLGVGVEGDAASWRFVEGPHLFAVLATRARRRLVVVVSGDPPTRGLVADYLAQADAPPGPPRPARGDAAEGTLVGVGVGVGYGADGWVASLAAELGRAGVRATCGYPTGRHVLDLVVADPGHDRVLECRVHPDGAHAHIDRHLALARAGWEVTEAHRSRWGHRQAELVVDLANQLL